MSYLSPGPSPEIRRGVPEQKMIEGEHLLMRARAGEVTLPEEA
jgi:hypothetical protein